MQSLIVERKKEVLEICIKEIKLKNKDCNLAHMEVEETYLYNWNKKYSIKLSDIEINELLVLIFNRNQA